MRKAECGIAEKWEAARTGVTRPTRMGFGVGAHGGPSGLAMRPTFVAFGRFRPVSIGFRRIVRIMDGAGTC